MSHMHTLRHSHNTELHSYTQAHTCSARDMSHTKVHTQTQQHTLRYTDNHTHRCTLRCHTGSIMGTHVHKHKHMPTETHAHTEMLTPVSRSLHGCTITHTSPLPLFLAHRTSAVFVCLQFFNTASVYPDVDYTGVLDYCSCQLYPLQLPPF